MLTFAIGPVHRDEEGEELRERAGQKLGEVLGRKLRVVAYESYPALEAAVRDSRADLAWVSPAVYARLALAGRAELVASVARGEGHSYRGVLFVKREAKASSASDLAGLRIGWVDRDSCAGHLYPRLALSQRGLSADTLFSEQRFLGSHGSVVRAVMRGEVDAGATYAQLAPDGERILVAAWAAWAGAEAMRAVVISDPIPADPIVARAGFSRLDETKSKLLSCHELPGMTDLLDELLGGPRLREASDHDYDAVRALL